MDPLQTFSQDAMTTHNQPSIGLEQAVEYQLLDDILPDLLAGLQPRYNIPQQLLNFNIILDKLMVVLLVDHLHDVIRALVDGIPQPCLPILTYLTQTTDVHPDYLGKQDILGRFWIFQQLESLNVECLLRIYQVL